MRPMHFWYHCKTLNNVVCTFAVWQFQPKRTKAIGFRVIFIFDVCKFMMFTSCFTIGKAYRCRTFPHWGARLGYHLILGSFCECPHPWGFILHLGLYFKCSEIILLMRTLHWDTLCFKNREIKHLHTLLDYWTSLCFKNWEMKHLHTLLDYWTSPESTNIQPMTVAMQCIMLSNYVTNYVKKLWLVWRIMYVTPLCTPKVAVSLQQQQWLHLFFHAPPVPDSSHPETIILEPQQCIGLGCKGWGAGLRLGRRFRRIADRQREGRHEQ